ncbi:MAG: S1 RNA-binding domain-containing protein [Ruminococcaceae bacterium]|nr:S1 RNA-binding domain-containing protein [Oscillospiraceae bacterium]
MTEYRPEGSLITTDKNYEHISSRSALERAAERQVILEAPVALCDHNFNLHISLAHGIEGIMPREEVQYLEDGEEIKDIAILTRVGKTVCFKIIGFNTLPSGKTVAYLSRKAAQRECVENYISTLIPGDIIPAKVTHLESFGAFVDIGCGIISLLSIDSISVSRISHPASRMCAGDNILTVVKGIDERGRIFLSSRELLGTWEENAERFSEGQTVRGIIRSVEDYGVFVELMPNLAGLAEYRPDVKPGQTAAVYIKSIIPEKMKIKLIIIDAQSSEEPHAALEYFVDCDRVSHIDSWKYSPPTSKKIIETVF